MRRRRWITSFGWRLFVVVVATFLLAVLLRQLGDDWSAAIQGTATVVLVIVTSVYAYSTFRLVDAQEQGPTRAAQIAAIGKVLTTAHRHGVLPGQIGVHMAKDLDDMTPEKSEHIGELIKDTEELRDSLIEQVILLPEPLYDQCWDAIWKIWHATDAGRAVLKAVSEEGNASIHNGRLFDPARVRTLYYDEFRDDLEDKPEWDELADGSYFDHASTHVRMLVDRCRDYVVESRRK